MPIANSDVQIFPSASSPLNDSTTSGGSFVTTHRLMGSILITREKLEVVSANAADTTQTLTIRGISFGGLIISEDFILNGTTVVKGLVEFRRITEISLSAAASGNISARKQSDNSVIHTVVAGIIKYATLFKNVWPSEGQTINRYEKVFVKNNHATIALVAAAVGVTVDNTGALTFGLATSVNDSLSVANRLTVPAGITFSATKGYINVPGTNLAAQAAIGVWVKQALAAKKLIAESSALVEVGIGGT